MRMQDKIVKRIHTIAAKHKLEIAESWEWPNIGNLHFQRVTDFETRFTVHVDFQPHRFGGGILRQGDHVCNGASHSQSGYNRERSWYADYREPGAVQRALDRIEKEAADVG